jgi:hypothetical protein
MKSPGNAGDLVAGDLPGFPEFRRGFSTLSSGAPLPRRDRVEKITGDKIAGVTGVRNLQPVAAIAR